MFAKFRKLHLRLGVASLSIGLLTSVVGAGIAVNEAGASPSVATIANNVATFQLPTMDPGASAQYSAVLSNGATASVTVTDIAQSVSTSGIGTGATSAASPDSTWNTVFELDDWCTDSGIQTSWFHVYEGFSGNGTKVTNAAPANLYFHSSATFTLSSSDAGTPYISGGDGYDVTQARYSTGYGPLGLHDSYYNREQVMPNDTQNPYVQITCSGLGT